MKNSINIMKSVLLWIVVALLPAAIAFPQGATIRVDANLVLTPVLVVDAEGKSIRDLKPEDFTVEENGKQVTVARLGEPGEASLEMALLFDVSGTVYSLFEKERTAAIRFIRRIMRPYDSAFIISVGNEPGIIQEKTNSLETMLKSLAAVSPTTQTTALFNSIIKAEAMSNDSEQSDVRRVMVVISDGEDNRSVGTNPENIIRELQLTNTLFYSINPNGHSYNSNYFGRRGEEMMEELARQTGGAAFIADNEEGMAAFFDHIADELQGQYLLGYYSPATSSSGIYRKISITVKGRPNLTVKARPGYYPK
jgi:Ca-activated chloride channel homolog